MKIIGLAVLLSALVSHFGIKYEQPLATMLTEMAADWQTLDEDNYKIEYPSDWTLDRSGQMGMSFLLLSERSDSDDQFRENVNLIIQDLGGQTITLDQYVQLSEDQIKTLITNSNLLKSERLRSPDTDYHHVVYTGDQGTFALQFEQHYYIVHGKAYVLTFTAEQSAVEEYQRIARQVLSSFTLKTQ